MNSIPGELLTCDSNTHKLIHAIMQRFRNDRTTAKPFDWISLGMDLTVCHNRGHLDLPLLLAAEPFDFAHDITGIAQHLDHETGELTDCFLPRCRKPESEAPR